MNFIWIKRDTFRRSSKILFFIYFRVALLEFIYIFLNTRLAFRIANAKSKINQEWFKNYACDFQSSDTFLIRRKLLKKWADLVFRNGNYIHIFLRKRREDIYKNTNVFSSFAGFKNHGASLHQIIEIFRYIYNGWRCRILFFLTASRRFPGFTANFCQFGNQKTA